MTPEVESVAPRRAWVAVLLTLLLPGLGHLYAGAPRRALFVWLIYILYVVSFVLVLTILSEMILPPVLVLPSAVLAGGLFATLAAWDAARSARSAGPGYVLRHYNRWYGYTALFLLAVLLVQPRYLRLLHHFLNAYQIPNTSMEPTLSTGDYILARPLRRPPTRGQIVIYRRRMGARVKRVVGMPGDTLAMKDGILRVNGNPVSEPYASHAHERSIFDAEFMWQRRFVTPRVDTLTYHPTLTFWGPIVIPAGDYFVLGDNRGESADSRYTGFVAADSVVEQPICVYFSRDPQTRSIRWNRIGTRFNGP